MEREKGNRVVKNMGNNTYSKKIKVMSLDWPSLFFYNKTCIIIYSGHEGEIRKMG